MSETASLLNRSHESKQDPRLLKEVGDLNELKPINLLKYSH
jgi:hypothetical protein